MWNLWILEKHFSFSSFPLQHATLLSRCRFRSFQLHPVVSGPIDHEPLDQHRALTTKKRQQDVVLQLPNVMQFFYRNLRVILELLRQSAGARDQHVLEKNVQSVTFLDSVFPQQPSALQTTEFLLQTLEILAIHFDVHYLLHRQSACDDIDRTRPTLLRSTTTIQLLLRVPPMLLNVEQFDRRNPYILQILPPLIFHEQGQ
mmetsp:Transcript_11221/g.20274  ORF Transcript_11221/g.20274 Transcript_11221/m.20274 type:complete len:201 (-) Transcript_11221:1432-2034(-)